MFPIVPIYFLVTWLRNKFYDFGIFKSSEFDIPTICVGNLSVGGTGKTPMIEYLIRLLQTDYRLATLSRGYKRTSDGFMMADATSTASTVGDEPFQFYNKFENIIVSVDADRRNGISILVKSQNPPKVILLDDAFQHRKVKAKFNILLTPYNDLYSKDWPLPTGNLREPRSGAKRADVIVVTKCPETITEIKKEKIIRSLNPKSNQTVFFSWIVYSDSMKNTLSEKNLSFLIGKKFTLVTGIANSKPLVDYLNASGFDFDHINFKDHHEFTMNEIEHLKTKEFILTTEKDYMRLSPHFMDDNSLFYLPIELKLDRALVFQELITGRITQKE